MKVLLAHRFLPGQLVHVARALAADPGNEVVALFEQDQGEPPVPRLRTVRVEPEEASGTASHPFLSTLETQVRSGTAAYRACAALRAEGFLPDVMVAHAGSGSGLYLRDAFPEAPLLGYFEWFFGSLGTDLDFVQPEALTSDDLLRRHTTNACTLTELVQCDAGLSPTAFQRASSPASCGPRSPSFTTGSTRSSSPATALRSAQRGPAPPRAAKPRSSPTLPGAWSPTGAFSSSWRR